KWLGEHPGVELVSRDRWSAYAQATAEAAPQAQQVADRWHLLKNLREAIERLFERQSTVIGAVLQAAEAPAQTAWRPVVTVAGGAGGGGAPAARRPVTPRAAERTLRQDGRARPARAGGTVTPGATERTGLGFVATPGPGGEAPEACRAIRASSPAAPAGSVGAA